MLHWFSIHLYILFFSVSNIKTLQGYLTEMYSKVLIDFHEIKHPFMWGTEGTVRIPIKL